MGNEEHLVWESRMALREICASDPARAEAAWERERHAGCQLADAVRQLRPAGSLARALDVWDETVGKKEAA